MTKAHFAPIKRLATIPALIFLGACTSLSALSLQEHPGDQSRNLRIDYGQCFQSGQFAPALDQAAAVSFVLDGIQSAFKSALEKKLKRFSATYTIKATLNNLSPGHCLQIQRLDENGDKALLDLKMEIVDRGAGSIEFVPKRLSIVKFATSTSPDDGKLRAKIAISAGIAYVNRNPVQGPDPVTELIIPIASTNYTIGESSLGVLDGQSSKLIPSLTGRPVNIAISITETGNGAADLKSGLEGFDDNAEALRAILGIEE